MSFYGKKWLVSGLPTGLIMRSVPENGRYTVVFEREFVSLEQIEAVNWAQPAVECVGASENGPGLTEGYGFTVEDIQYDSRVKAYHVVLRTAGQHLGDVTGYQDQITQLERASAEKDKTITAQAATIQSQTEQIKALESSGGGAAITAKLEAAYTEGVESNG